MRVKHSFALLLHRSTLLLGVLSLLACMVLQFTPASAAGALIWRMYVLYMQHQEQEPLTYLSMVQSPATWIYFRDCNRICGGSCWRTQNPGCPCW